VALVVRDDREVVNEGGRSDQYVGVADGLAAGMQVGVDVCRYVHDLVRQRQNIARGAEPRKRIDLRRSAFGLEAAQDFVACDHGETESPLLGEVGAGLPDDGRNAPHQGRENVRVEQGRACHRERSSKSGRR
jgi:hypothetical protein